MIKIDQRLHANYRPVAEAEFDSLVAFYPTKLVRLDLYDPLAGDTSLGHCTSADAIELNAYWFAEPRVKLDMAVARGRECEPQHAMAWHGRIGGVDGEFRRLLCHEYGHLLAVPDAPAFSRRGHAMAIANPAVAVSGYALVDPQEWWAETFAALRLGGSGPQVGELAAFLLEHLSRRDEATMSKEKARYVDDGEKDHCRDCTMFRESGRCTLVEGRILPGGHCRYFSRR